MKVRFANTISNEKELIGGSLQGTLLGGTNYIIASSNVDVEEEGCDEDDHFSYYDDLCRVHKIAHSTFKHIHLFMGSFLGGSMSGFWHLVWVHGMCTFYSRASRPKKFMVLGLEFDTKLWPV